MADRLDGGYRPTKRVATTQRPHAGLRDYRVIANPIAINSLFEHFGLAYPIIELDRRARRGWSVSRIWTQRPAMRYPPSPKGVWYERCREDPD